MNVEVKNVETVFEKEIDQWGHVGGFKKFAGRKVKILVLEG